MILKIFFEDWVCWVFVLLVVGLFLRGVMLLLFNEFLLLGLLGVVFGWTSLLLLLLLYILH